MREIQIASSAIDMFKANFTNDEKYLKDMDEIKKLIEIKELEVMDITCDLQSITVSKQTRKKRFAPDLRAELEEMQNFMNEIIKKVAHQVNDLNMTKEIGEKVVEFSKTIFRQNMLTQLVSIEKSIEAIITLQTQQRLNSDLVSFEDFQVQLSEIKESIMENEELPYDKINKFYYNIKATHEINKVSNK